MLMTQQQNDNGRFKHVHGHDFSLSLFFPFFFLFRILALTLPQLFFLEFLSLLVRVYYSVQLIKWSKQFFSLYLLWFCFVRSVLQQNWLEICFSRLKKKICWQLPRLSQHPLLQQREINCEFMFLLTSHRMFLYGGWVIERTHTLVCLCLQRNVNCMRRKQQLRLHQCTANAKKAPSNHWK